MTLDTMPRTVIAWGVGLAIGGALLIVMAPMASTMLYATGAFATPSMHDASIALQIFDLLVSVARAVLPPLGAALIAAGLVMIYLDRRLAGDRIADRPRRWRWPDQRDDPSAQPPTQ